MTAIFAVTTVILSCFQYCSMPGKYCFNLPPHCWRPCPVVWDVSFSSAHLYLAEQGLSELFISLLCLRLQTVPPVLLMHHGVTLSVPDNLRAACQHDKWYQGSPFLHTHDQSTKIVTLYRSIFPAFTPDLPMLKDPDVPVLLPLSSMPFCSWQTLKVHIFLPPTRSFQPHLAQHASLFIAFAVSFAA